MADKVAILSDAELPATDTIGEETKARELPPPYSESDPQASGIPKQVAGLAATAHDNKSAIGWLSRCSKICELMNLNKPFLYTSS